MTGSFYLFFIATRYFRQVYFLCLCTIFEAYEFTSWLLTNMNKNTPKKEVINFINFSCSFWKGPFCTSAQVICASKEAPCVDRPSLLGAFHILIGRFFYFVIRFLNHIFFVINFSYIVIIFFHSSIVKSDNEIGKINDKNKYDLKI